MDQGHPFDAFVATIKALRGPGGCPWDNEQTIQSLTPYIIEEAYELVAAIKSLPFIPEDLCEELGDVLLHVVMIANMADEQHLFNINDVIQTIREKMIRRHPHVFGTHSATSATEVIKNWAEIKALEKTSATADIDAIPTMLPGLIQLQKLLKCAMRSAKETTLPLSDSPWVNQLETLAKLANEQDINLEDLLQDHVRKIRSHLKGFAL